MKYLLLSIALLLSQYGTAQPPVVVVNQTSFKQLSYQHGVIGNPYTNTQTNLEKGNLQDKLSLSLPLSTDLQKAVLLVTNATDSLSIEYYTEPDGTYEIIVQSLKPANYVIKETNSSINEAIAAINQKFYQLEHKKDYFDGTRNNALTWLYLGRDKNNFKSAIGTIRKNVNYIKKQSWYQPNKRNIDFYLAVYLYIDDFKNNRLARYLQKSSLRFANPGQNISNTFYAEGIKMIYGFSLWQYHHEEDMRYGKVEAGLDNTYRAFKTALNIVDTLANDTLRQLATLALFNDYYHSVDCNWQSKEEIIIPGLRQILANPHHQLIKEWADHLLAEQNKIRIGQKAPDFTLVSYDGDSISLADLRGKYVYLDFWYSRCGACFIGQRNLIALAPQYKDKITFVSINGFDSFDRGKMLATENNFTGIKLHAGKNHLIHKNYNVIHFPTYYLIGPDGRFFYKPKDSYEIELPKIKKLIEAAE